MLDPHIYDNDDLYHMQIFKEIKKLQKDIIVDFGEYFPTIYIYHDLNIKYDIESYHKTIYGLGYHNDIEHKLQKESSNKYIYYNSEENKIYYLFEPDVKKYNGVSLIDVKNIERFIKINKLRNSCK